MARPAAGTYVFCLVAAARRPSLKGASRRHTGMGRVRLVEVDRRLWLVVADAPLDRYGADAINRGLSDLDWVSRAAIAHEAVVESFVSASAVVPMKLFTIFTSDARAVDHIVRERPRVDAVLKRVANHVEWGVRVVLDRAQTPGARRRPARAATGARGARDAPVDARGAGTGRESLEPPGTLETTSGAAFLTRKKAQRDAIAELAERAREVVAGLYDRLAALARVARRRAAREQPVPGGPLLLDAAFLVPRTRSARFEKLATGASRDLARHGYRVTVSGPWPPYSFIEG
jgi:hypothetical protein